MVDVNSMYSGCKYYSVGDFNDAMNNDFLIFHQNIRSFNKNYDDLSVFLDSLNPDIDILVLTETWFSDGYFADINGFNAYHSYRCNGNGGGVSIYVRTSIPAESIVNDSYMSDSIEYCMVSIGSDVRPKLNIVGIYRPPNASIDDFVSVMMNKFLSNSNNIQMILCGDFNVDLVSASNASNSVVDMFNSFNFYPLVTLPTRVSNNSATCIDHIWYNEFNVGVAGIFVTDITDHYTIFVSLRYEINRNLSRVIFRDHSDRNLDCLRSRLPHLIDTYFEARTNNCSLNEVVDLFVGSLWNVYSESCPLRYKDISNKRLSKPWINGEMLRLINTKHKLFKQFKRGIINFDIYKNYKKFVSTRLKYSKRQYYSTVFESCRGDLRRTWRSINNVLKGRTNNHKISLLDDNDNEVEDPKHVADMFCSYFSSVASDLEKDIPAPITSPMDYMGPIANSSFYIKPSSATEVNKLILSIPNKGSHINNIPVFIYKIIASHISLVISDMFNYSVSLGIFPLKFKLSRITPLFKSSEKYFLKNYRPISVVPFLSKLFEKLMSSRMNLFIKEKNLISVNQFGFRANRSTADAALEFVNETVDAVDNKGYSIAVFLDLKKAFDTVNHTILLNKMERMGFRGMVLEWFRSYLSGRRISVYANGTLSDERNVNIGLPQGAVCSPLLFLMYINDMSNVCSDLKCVQFADDTTLFLTGDNLPDLTQRVNNDLKVIDQWLISNRLSLNIAKTKFMIFTHNINLPNVNLEIRDIPLERVTSIEFLGLTVDDNLKFQQHVNKVCSKLSRALGILYRLSTVVPPQILLTLYFSMFYSHLTYGITIWGGCGIVNIGRVNRIHRRASNLVVSSFLNIGIDRKLCTFGKIYDYFVALKMYRCIYSDDHTYFNNRLLNLQPIHAHSTRFTHSFQYNIPHYNKSLSHNFFIYQGVRVWNFLPYEIKTIDSFKKFKYKLKLYFSQ